MKYLEELKQAVMNEDFYETDEVLKKIKSEETDLTGYTEQIFRIMEENPDIDYGIPGPLVHFVEAIDNYESLLVESVKRFPIPTTVWMINRILNVTKGEEREMYMELLASGISREDISDRTRKDAEHFYSYQKSREK